MWIDEQELKLRQAAHRIQLIPYAPHSLWRIVQAHRHIRTKLCCARCTAELPQHSRRVSRAAANARAVRQILFQPDPTGPSSQFGGTPDQIARVHRNLLRKRTACFNRKGRRGIERKPVTDVCENDETVEKMVAVIPLTSDMQAEIHLRRRECLNRH